MWRYRAQVEKEITAYTQVIVLSFDEARETASVSLLLQRL
jgi:hypothetical protein